jgi:hypothetical protein
MALAALAGATCHPVPPPPLQPAPAASLAQLPEQQPAELYAQDAAADSAPDGDAADLAQPAPALGPGEHWQADYRSSDACEDYRVSNNVRVYRDPLGPNRKFSYDGYVYRQLELVREIDGQPRRHCVDVYWPPGDKNSDGKRVDIAKKLKPSWLRLLERTLVRLPWKHLQFVERFVIDNRPLLHGVAPFHRGALAEDARDGRTIWLNEHLFTGVNHWVHGTYGHYWGYHLPVDNVAPAKLAADHELFSPVLLHELGHLVNYNVVNGAAGDPTCPKCSEMCGDLGNCKELKPEQREALCATAYCTGFGHESGTENWAEMYRWYYAGRTTRQMLKEHFPACFAVFEGDDTGSGINAGRAAPWDEGLGEVVGYRKTRWDSCKDKACKSR